MQSRLSSLQPGLQVDTWLLDADPETGVFHRCANLDSPAACNWLLPVNDHDALCIACSLNRTIPDLSMAENHGRWRKVETAKRRLVAQLVSLGLGRPDFYPFVLPPSVIAKLHFIHLVIQQEGGRADEMLQDL